MLQQLITLALKLESDLAAGDFAAAAIDVADILTLIGTAPAPAIQAHAARLASVRSLLNANLATPNKIDWGGLLSKLLPVILQILSGLGGVGTVGS
jgi:hypothetical protein